MTIVFDGRSDDEAAACKASSFSKQAFATDAGVGGGGADGWTRVGDRSCILAGEEANWPDARLMLFVRGLAMLPTPVNDETEPLCARVGEDEGWSPWVELELGRRTRGDESP